MAALEMQTRRELPRGTVTFLFTDVEGSTRTLLEEGDRYAEMLAAHRRLIREALDVHGGCEMGTEGDAVFAVFQRASDAVSAAARAQEALRGGPLRVRMGLHTGEPHLTASGYVGLDVHRAARIAAAAHGGQVLLSHATCELVDADVRDLGEYRLKDLPGVERISQLGDERFPALRAPARADLPPSPTSFVGRVEELGAVIALLAREHVRLLTLIGPGGSGKTRLALAAARRAAPGYPDGARWVPLASVTDARMVGSAVADALGTRRAAADEIGERRMLIVLDNFEHVVAAADHVASLVATCPRLDVLVTSREAIHVQGEWEYRVEPMGLDDAVALFRERAAQFDRDSDDEVVAAEICRRVDCLPLALELAAARVSVLPPRALLTRLERRMPVLTGGARDAPERHRTLRATIAWSHDLLNAREQRLFARLGVFVGGCTLTAAEDVCGADLDTFSSLVDKSLLRRDGDRFQMLETVREFAIERLDASGERDTVRTAHAAWFADLAERARAHLRRGDSPVWSSLLDAEHDNLRAAVRSALDRNDGVLPWRLTGALWLYWLAAGHLAEGRELLDATLAGRPPQNPHAEIEPLWGAAMLSIWLRDLSAGETRAAELEAISNRVGDVRGQAAAAHLQGIIAGERGDTALARALNLRAVELARQAEDDALVAVSTNDIAVISLLEGDLDAAEDALQETLTFARRGRDLYLAALAHSNLSHVALMRGDRQRSRRQSRECLVIASRLGRVDHIAAGLLGLGLVSLGPDPLQAVRLIAASDAVLERVGAAHHRLELRMEDQALAQARERLGEPAFRSAYAAGRALTLDAAIAEAIDGN